MKKYYSRRRFELIILLLIVIIYGVKFSRGFYAESEGGEHYLTARILSVVLAPDNPDTTEGFTIYNVLVEFLSSPYRGQKVMTTFEELENDVAARMDFEPGDKVVMVLDDPEHLETAKIDEHYRAGPLVFLLILFSVVLIAIGGRQGFLSLISLVFTIILIFEVFLPLTLAGWPPLILAFVICFVSTGITLLAVSGFNPKTLSAILGVSCGIIVSSVIALLFGNIMHFTGAVSEESLILIYSMQSKIDFRGILFSGMIIGAVGALMDIGISISSSVEEIHRANRHMSPRSLFKAGMNVGRDVMGTMTNTLVLAYVGDSILLILLLFAQNSYPMIKVFNLELITAEFLRAGVGGLGLVITIPITAFFASVMISKESFIAIEED